MKWIKASDELPTKDGTYFIIDTRYETKKVVHFSNKHNGSLLHRQSKFIIWAYFTFEEEKELAKKYLKVDTKTSK